MSQYFWTEPEYEVPAMQGLSGPDPSGGRSGGMTTRNPVTGKLVRHGKFDGVGIGNYVNSGIGCNGCGVGEVSTVGAGVLAFASLLNLAVLGLAGYGGYTVYKKFAK